MAAAMLLLLLMLASLAADVARAAQSADGTIIHVLTESPPPPCNESIHRFTLAVAWSRLTAPLAVNHGETSSSSGS